MTTLILIAITFVLVMGFKIVMSEGMLLERVGEYFDRKIKEGHKVYDMFYCEWCMPTLCSLLAHGFAIGLGILPFEWDWKLLIREPLIVMGASFISGNAWNIYLTINKIREKNEEECRYYGTLNDNLTSEDPLSAN